MLETERLIFLPWREEDAEELFRYASDPRVGPPAGWPPHKSAEESRNVIRTVLSKPETYALILKETGAYIGCIALKTGDATDIAQGEREAELGYWLAPDYWGQGLMPEAVREIQRRAFRELGMETLWCAYYEGNDKSRRVQEKCGFRFHHFSENVFVPLMNEYRNGYVNRLTRAQWEKENI